MANPITIHSVALPSFDSALRLYQQSGQGYQDAFSKLTATVTGTENALKAKHDAELQALINSAGSPAELASPEFQAKVQQAKDSMYGTFDQKALTSYLDSRPDTLITRDNNALQNTLNRLNVADTTRKSEMLWNTQDAIKALGVNPSMQSVHDYLRNNPNPLDWGNLLSTFANGRSLQDAQTKANVESQTRQLAQFALSGGKITQEMLSQFPDADLTAVQAAMDKRTQAQWDIAARQTEVEGARLQNQNQQILANALGLGNPPSPGQFTSEMGNLPNPAGYDAFVQSSAVTQDLPAFSKNIAPYENAIMDLSKEFNIPPALIMSMIWKESLGNPKAESETGAYGLMQLVKGTARDMKVDRYDPVQNLRGGVKYMRFLLDRYDNNLERALAAYNAGMGAIERAEKETGSIYNTPNKQEVSDVVPSVLKRFRYLSSMQGNGMGAIVPGSTGPSINPNNIKVVGGNLAYDGGQIPAGTSSQDIAALATAGLVPGSTGEVGGSGGGQSRGQIKGIGSDVLSAARLDLNSALTQLKTAYDAAQFKPLPTTAKSWGELHLNETNGWIDLDFNVQSRTLEQLIKHDPKASTLPEATQIALAERILSRSKATAFTGTADWFPGRKDNQDEYKRMLQEELASATAGSAERYEQNRLNVIRASVNALQIKVRSVNSTVSYNQIADALDIPDKDQLALGYINKDEYERRTTAKTSVTPTGKDSAGKPGGSKPKGTAGVLKEEADMRYPLVKLKGPEVPIPPSMFLGNVGNGGQLPGIESTIGPGGLKLFRLDANNPTAGYQPSFLSIVAPKPFNPRDPHASGDMTISELEQKAAEMRDAVQPDAAYNLVKGFGKPRLVFSDPAMANTVAEHERGITALQAVGKYKEAQQLEAKLQGIIQKYYAEVRSKEEIFRRAAASQRAALRELNEREAREQQNMDAAEALKLLRR